MAVNVSVKRRVQLRGHLDDIYAAAGDVARTGNYSTGVLQVEPLGDNKFAWFLEPQSAFGIDFTGLYVTQHEMLPGEIRWTTVQGNMHSEGSYVFEENDEGTRVTAKIATRLPLDIPALMKTPAELFIQHRLMKQIADLFNRIDDEGGVA